VADERDVLLVVRSLDQRGGEDGLVHGVGAGNEGTVWTPSATAGIVQRASKAGESVKKLGLGEGDESNHARESSKEGRSWTALERLGDGRVQTPVARPPNLDRLVVTLGSVKNAESSAPALLRCARV
jgi:hypothetical protein